MARVYIITAGKMQFKTSRCISYANALMERGFKVGGLVAPGEIEEGERLSFRLKRLGTNDEKEFAHREAREGWDFIKAFYFNPEAIKWGSDCLMEDRVKSDYLFLDEVGRFEMQGKIWGPVLEKLLCSSGKLVLSIRDIFLEDFVNHFKIEQYVMVSSLEDLL